MSHVYMGSYGPQLKINANYLVYSNSKQVKKWLSRKEIVFEPSTPYLLVCWGIRVVTIEALPFDPFQLLSQQPVDVSVDVPAAPNCKASAANCKV